MEHRFNYNWTLKDANFTKDKGKVFSCFACGGGSTMGYKLAGFDVIGCNEIDPKMNKCYVANHNPKFNYLCDIRDLVKMENLPEELYNLDILDGSPPCSVFSQAGSREEAWGVEKKFREGQKAQVLDTLFFDFIALANKLRPKVVVAENVKGLLLGNAVEYVKRIHEEFDKAGYYCEHFLLNGSKMGVPQKRERVFFLCIRKDIAGPVIKPWGLFGEKPVINLDFNETPITCRDCNLELSDDIKGCYSEDYDRMKNGEDKKYFQSLLVELDDVHPTIVAGYRDKASPMPAWEKKWLSTSDLCKIGSYPQDYDFGNCKPQYLIGMSVPPIMTAQVATQIYEQWLSKLNK